MKSFLEKLQSSDEGTKTRWMIVLTIIIMIVVAYVWMAYFNTLISGFSGTQVVAQEQTEGGGFGFWRTMKSGMATIHSVFMDKLHVIGDILNTPREYIIKPPK